MTTLKTAEVRRLPSRSRAELERAVMDAVKAVANFQPTEIFGTRGDAADAANLADDVRTVADIADGLIFAIARYAADHIDGVDPRDFAGVCRIGVDDNCAFILDRRASDLAEDSYSDGQRHDFQRSMRA